MFDQDEINIAIVDYGLGNLFSVKRACEYFGARAIITNGKEEILSADAVILPGVGAFGYAMNALRSLDLVAILQDLAESSKPIMGICLGMQLLMNKSYELGNHDGLGIIKGVVRRFENPADPTGKRLKVPQIGWNQIYVSSKGGEDASWENSVLGDLSGGEFMYFNHSFYVQPEEPEVILSVSHYGNIEFCSSIERKNVFACQFHPERSGIDGLKIYGKLISLI